MCNDFSQLPFAPIGIMATPGGRDIAGKIDAQLVIQRKELIEIYPRFEDCPGFLRDSYIIDCDLPRFGNGEGKAVINESIRGFELYFITDIGNCGVKYNKNGADVTISPDEHYQDIKRLISATRGLGYKNNAILPLPTKAGSIKYQYSFFNIEAFFFNKSFFAFPTETICFSTT